MFDDGRPISPRVDRLRSRGLIRCWKPGASPADCACAAGCCPSIQPPLPRSRWASPKITSPSPSTSHLLQLRRNQGPSRSTRRAAPLLLPQPARYIWSQSAEYPAPARSPCSAPSRSACIPPLQTVGPHHRANVTHFLANSQPHRGEIARCYRRESTVIHPPVRTGFFTPDPAVPREPFWLIAGAIEPYKRAIWPSPPHSSAARTS